VAALFDFAHPWAQPFGRSSFGTRPIRLSLPNCGCGPWPLYVLDTFPAKDDPAKPKKKVRIFEKKELAFH